MASRLRTLARTRPTASLLRQQMPQRSFQTSQTLRQDAVTPAKKPVGAFRGTLFGFLFGSVLAGSGLYYYVIDDYKVSNELLTEDIYALQAAVQRIEGYVKTLEEEVQSKRK